MAETRDIEIRLRSRGAERSAGRLDSRVVGVGNSADRAERSLFKMTRVALALGAALATGKVTQYADAWTKVTNQIKQTTNSTTEALTVQEAIFKIAKDSRVEINGVADAYQRISNSISDFGFSAKDSLDVVEGLTKAFKANGSSAEEVSSILVQLGQGLGAGALQGDELKSIMEASLPVSRAIAKEFGVQVGQLKELGAAGELVTERVFKALQNSLPEFQSSFAKANVSISEGLTVVGSSLTRLVGLTSDATGAAESLTSGMIDLSKGIDLIGDAVVSGAAGKIGEVFSSQLDLIRQDVITTTNLISDLWLSMGLDITKDTQSFTFDIGDAFLNMVPNIRTMTQVLTVELAASLDKVIAYGVATKDAFNPFDDADIDDARAALGKKTKDIDKVRELTIQSIFDQRQVEQTAQKERLKESEDLIEAYRKQREERSRLLQLESDLEAALSGDSAGEVFGFTPIKPKAEEETDTKSFDSLLARLKLETEAIKVENEIRAAIEEGRITEAEGRLTESYINETTMAFAQFESDLERMTLEEEQKEALRLQFRETQIANAQAFEGEMLGIVAASEKDKAAIERAAQNAKINMISSGAKNGLSLLSAFGKNSSKLQKTFAIADAVVNIASGVAKALNNPYPANLGFAAQVATQGAGLLSTIKGASPSGSSSAPSISATSSPSSPASAPAPAVASQNQNRVITFIGLENFGPDDLIPMSRSQFENYVSQDENVNVAINSGQQSATRTGAI